MPEDTTPTPAPTPAQVETKGQRFAAYDNTLERFVGGTHDTKAKAKAAAKGVDDVTIREV